MVEGAACPSVAGAVVAAAVLPVQCGPRYSQ